MTSLPEDFSHNYDGEIAEFWQQQFRRLPEHAAILDVGTGNGAIALLAAEYQEKNKSSLKIQALDAAKIYPERLASSPEKWSAYLSKIEFIDQTPFESFKAPAHSFDLIFSQYGLEYCDWPSAAIQCKSLIKPGGRLVIVSHSVDTKVLKTMLREHEQYQRLINSGLIQYVLSAVDSHQDHARAGLLIESAITQLKQAQAMEWAPVIDYALRLAVQVRAMNIAQIKAAKDQIIAACQQLNQGYSRLSQMLSVNMKMNENREWTEIFVNHGLERVAQGSLDYMSQHRVGDYFIFSQPNHG